MLLKHMYNTIQYKNERNEKKNAYNNKIIQQQLKIC